MDKRMLQTYSVWAKENLEKQIEVSLKTLGINSDTDIKRARRVGDFTVIEGDSNSYPASMYENRNFIADLVRSNGYRNIIEEIAYTWFNRLVALRFMEVHDFLPHGFRVLSSRTGDVEPEILKNLGFVKSELGLNMDTIGRLRDEGNIEGLFRYVLLRQCAALSNTLPMLFSNESDYLSLLLPQTLLTGDTVLTRLIAIPEDNFLNDVEIIGWMYQFYISVKKDEVFASKKTITKDTLPAVTQLFTPDWIVRYMAENSVGRIWMESYPASPLRAEMKYYVDDAKQTDEVQRRIDAIKYRNVNPEEIRVIEPCCGSGHILVYVFDLLYRMYEEKGYQKREIPTLILSKNLVGLDVDKRAAQLASFALAMKARSVNNRFFDKTYYAAPRVYEIIDSHRVEQQPYQRFLSDAHLLTDDEMADIKYLIETFRYGKTIGSLLKVKRLDFAHLREQLDTIDRTYIQDVFGTVFKSVVLPTLRELITLAELLSSKYDVVITNPPYVGTAKMEDHVKQYVAQYYPSSKADMFAMFIEHGFSLIAQNGFNSMVTMQSWMFLSSYEQLRSETLQFYYIQTMMHMENMVMGIAFGTAATVFRKANIRDYLGQFQFARMSDLQPDINGSLVPTRFPIENERLSLACSSSFQNIPGSPIAYWVSAAAKDAFIKGMPIGSLGSARNGMKTGDNEVFVRQWWEIQYNTAKCNAKNDKEAKTSGAKWFPYNKGGEYRKWYGNNDCVVNWENGGKRVIGNAKAEGRHVQDYPDHMKFVPALTWSLITSSAPSFRYKQGHISDIGGMSLYASRDVVIQLLGFLNTKVAYSFLKILAPTVNFQAGDIARIPLVGKTNNCQDIVENCIACSKNDWDSFETSWDFKRHPLVVDLRLKAEYKNSQWAEDRISKCSSLDWLYNCWEGECQGRFNQLKSNEEELNRIFINIYGMQNELTPEVEDKDVTVRLADKERDVKSLISYFIGVIMGRYSLDIDGLAYAGGAWDASKYRTYQPDDDGIVPIYDGIGMQDGLTAKICELLKVVYGERFYKANIDFIADALGKAQNESSEETLNRYLNNGFYTDHLKTYQKRPIYWMLSSGKNSGFKCLLYMHRYNADTLARVNGKYFLPESTRLKNELDELLIRIRDAEGREKIRLEKTRQKVAAAYNEAIEYGQALDHMANQYIAIDLDDGVKVNYAKFQGVEMVTDSGTKVKKDLLVPIK